MSETKRQVLPPGLWVVATPIGNLDDLGPRARRALEEADAIVCEDTRRTAQLLAALGISGKPLERLDAHVERGEGGAARLERILARLESGESLALVSDAGTPGVSDPGQRLVRLARERGVRATPLPGPSAVAALISVSGFDASASFAFRGFFPRKAGERERELEIVAEAREAGAFAWFESPERVVDALEMVALRLPDARAVAAKELTKLHERIFAGSAREVSGAVAGEIAREGARGEWCFALEIEAAPRAESSEWVKALHCLVEARVSASVAAKQVSQHFGVSRNEAYEAALKATGKKSRDGD